MRASIKQLIDKYGPARRVAELPQAEQTRAFKEGRVLRIDMVGGGLGDRSYSVSVAKTSYDDYSIAFARPLPPAFEDSDDSWDSHDDVLREFGLRR
jgi:hypothetical protein